MFKIEGKILSNIAITWIWMHFDGQIEIQFLKPMMKKIVEKSTNPTLPELYIYI